MLLTDERLEVRRADHHRSGAERARSEDQSATHHRTAHVGLPALIAHRAERRTSRERAPVADFGRGLLEDVVPGLDQPWAHIRRLRESELLQAERGRTRRVVGRHVRSDVGHFRDRRHPRPIRTLVLKPDVVREQAQQHWMENGKAPPAKKNSWQQLLLIRVSMENGKAPRRTQTRKPRQVRPTPRAGGGSEEMGGDGHPRSRRPDGKKKRPRAGDDDDEPRVYGASRFGGTSGPSGTRDPLVRAAPRIGSVAATRSV
jgi:hypothetical protein